MIEEILRAGILAPSSKNRQPWKFIVTTENAKNEMLAAMRKGLNQEKECPLLPESAQYLNGAEYTLKIMEQAPVIIFVVNTLGKDIHSSFTPEEFIYEICNAQSIGAAIENMTLTATELGLGSLWICDTYFAYRELKNWLKVEGELFAAMAVGYADENPLTRPRKKLDDVVEWHT
jgi:nitroreductase